MSIDKKNCVKKFLNMYDGGNWPDFDETVSLFSKDTVYYVVYPTTPPVHGREALKKELIRQSKDSKNPKSEIKAMASEGEYVFVERVDSFVTLGKSISVSLCSVFEVGDDGLIKVWREYFDPTDTARQLGISGDKLGELLQG